MESPDDETPSAARRLFFREEGPVQPAGAIVGWWEQRRPAFNIAVGAAGLTTIAVVKVIALGFPASAGDGPPLMAVVAYAALANFMYTFGWVSELALRRFFRRKTPVVGAAIFRDGFAFSIGLTLLPIPIVTVGLILSRIFG
jgi:hypothetical protein